MNTPRAIDLFNETLQRFVEGTSDIPWRSLSQDLRGPWLRDVAPLAEDACAAESCWDLLSNHRFQDNIRSFYSPSKRLVSYEGVAERLARNARGLFAAAQAAAAARHADPSCDLPVILKWCQRAIEASGSEYQGEPAGSLSLTDYTKTSPEGLIERAWNALSPTAETAASARFWTHWWLNGLRRGDRGTKSTWLAWVVNGKSGDAGTVEVTDTGLHFTSLVEHPEVALIPVEQDWLLAVRRAWELSDCQSIGRTVSWCVHVTKSQGRRLGGQSAGGAFYVALACLRDRLPCDPSRAILAALPEGRKVTLRHVDPPSVSIKINALRENVRQCGVAEGQVVGLPHHEVELVQCSSLDNALEFMTGFAAKMRQYLLSVSEPRGGGEAGRPYIEPVLYKVQSPDTERLNSPGAGGELGQSELTRLADRAIGVTPRELIASLSEGAAGRAVVLAESGFGKTFLTQLIARNVADDALKLLDQGAAVLDSHGLLYVLHLDAGQLAAVAGNTDEISADGLRVESRAALNWLARAAATRYRGHEDVVRYLAACAVGERKGANVLLIVDGLDAVQPERRREITRLLRSIGDWPCRLLVTGRDYAFRPVDFEGGDVYRLRGFTLHESRRYVEGILGKERAGPLTHLLSSHRTVTHLSRVPVLLSIICRTVVETENEAVAKLSGLHLTRTFLYREFLLNRLGREVDPDLARLRLTLLQRVGYEWLQAVGASGEVTSKALLDWIGTDQISALPFGADPEKLRDLYPPVVAKSLLANFVTVGLFYPTQNREIYRVTHPSFIEYLAGAHLATRINDGEGDVIDELAGAALDPQWGEVLPFIAGTLTDPAPLLGEILIHPDPFHLRLLTVAACLAEVGTTRGLESDTKNIVRRLVSLLWSRSRLDRERAVEALAQVGVAWGQVVSTLLAPALSAQRSDVRALGLEAACMVGAAGAKDSALSYVRVAGAVGRDRLLRRLTVVEPEEAAKAAAELLSDNTLAVQATAFEMLVLLGSDNLDAVITWMRGGGGWSRRIAARALSLGGDAAAAEKIRPLLDEDVEHVRAAAVTVLASLDVPWRAEAIRAKVSDPSPEVRITAATALSKFGDERAIATLRSLLTDTEERVVLCALECVARHGLIEASDLKSLLEHPAVSVRMKAAAAMHLLGDRSGLERLVAAVMTGSGHEIFFALDALAVLGDQSAVEPLLTLLPSVAPTVQSKIAGTLGRLRDRRAVRPLIMLLESPEPGVRVEAASALGLIGDASSFEVLLKCLREDTMLVRRAAAAALSNMSDHAILPLLDALTLQDGPLATAAAHSIGSIANLDNLLAALKERGGASAFVRSHQRGRAWIVYELLYPLILSAPTASWAGDVSDLVSLTTLVSADQSPAAAP
jgi:HEAT repeat protein